MMPPNSSATHGPEGVKGYYDMRFLQGATGLEIEITEISGQGTLAYVTGTYSVRNEPAGGPPTRDRGKLLWIARHLPGNNWRFEVQMWSSDLPPQVPQPESQKE
jgi:ketosteroid isomerase-like protein